MLNSVKLEKSLCANGCELDDEIVLQGCDRLHNLPGEFTVVRCKTCGLMRTNPRPTPDSIGFYYPDDYGPYLGTLVSSSLSPSAPKKIIKSIVKKFINFQTKTIPSLKTGKMLEIGCASGRFLQEMAQQGWEVEGLEFSEKAAKSAKKLGYPIYTGSLENVLLAPASYDLIVGWMVLEHLHDPSSCLNKLHQATKADGWLVVSVPNVDSLDFQLFQHRWYALHLPNHLYHYDADSISILLKRNGWQVEKIFHHRTLTNFYRSLLYYLEDQGLKQISAKLKKVPDYVISYSLYPIAYLASLFGQTGRMTIWAKKIN